MGKASKCEQLRKIRCELIHGRSLARRLQTHICDGSLSSHQESSRLLIEGLVNSYNTSISMVRSPERPDHHPPPRRSLIIARSFYHSLDGALDDVLPCNTDKCGKRKFMNKWGKEVTISKGAGLEIALEDEFSWRKYGQKNILGSKYPRCTHKTTDGCLARKQVQRTDEEGPPVFSITYCGVHTCGHLQQRQQQQLGNSVLSPPNHGPTFPIHVLKQHHPNPAADGLIQLCSSTLPSDTKPIETMNVQLNRANSLSPFSMSSDDLYHHPSCMSSTTWTADKAGMDYYSPVGGSESDAHTAITSTVTGCPILGFPHSCSNEQAEFDAISDFVNWHFLDD